MIRHFHRSIQFSFLLIACYSTAAAATERHITVSGDCRRDVTPDRGTVTLTADSVDKEMKRAIQRATEAYERARKGIERLQLKHGELRTVEYSVQEAREWENNRAILKGYRARIGLRVSTSEISRLGEVTEIAMREEVREATALSTFFSPDLLGREKLACLQDAMASAREKAQKMAESLGAKVGSVVTIQEQSDHGGGRPPAPLPMMAEAKSFAAREGGLPQIEAGKSEISAQTWVTFTLKD